MALTVSKMTGGSNAHETTSEEANGLATDFVSEGIIGSYSNTGGVAPATGAFAVNAQGTPDMTVAVSSGVAYVTGTPTSQNSQTFRVYNSASENVTISANSSGSTKYDWVYIKLDATLLANPTLAGTTTATLVTSRSTSAGTDDGTPPTYGYPVAVVTVANGAVSITNSTIRDIRATASIGTAAGIATGWNETGLPAVSSVTNNGNRSYSVVFASTVASLLSPGMRLRTTRTVTAPTQCADLESGSSQSFSRASGSLTGISFVDDFSCSAWIKLESYTGVAQRILARYTTTTAANGFSFHLNSSGQLAIEGGAASVYRTLVSYQSIPLNKWVHVAGTLNMSANTGELFIDGVLVPSSISGAATALVQAGDLHIGNRGGGTEYFDGKIAQVGLFDAVLSASTIRSYMSQTLSGSETNCIGAWSLNGVLTDLDTNANTLTANGGALATATDSPFGQDSNGVTAGTTDHALVMKVSTTTATVQVPEGCTIPTSGGVSAVAYSTATSPFGFTLDKDRWLIQALLSNQTITSPVNGTWYNAHLTVAAFNTVGPIGAWAGGYETTPFVTRAAGICTVFATLSTGASSESDSVNTTRVYGNSITDIMASVKKERYLNFAVATTLYLNFKVDAASITSMQTSPGTWSRITLLPAGI